MGGGRCCDSATSSYCEERRELRRAGHLVPLQPKVLDLLAFLIRHRARVVPQAELLRALWPDSVVTPAVAGARAEGGAPRARRRRPCPALDPHAPRRRVSLRRRRRDAGATAPVPDYVGRGGAARRARRGARCAPRTARAPWPCCWVPPGIGKTRTAEEMLQRAERRGFRIVLARCAGAEDAPPLWPWRRIVPALEPDAGIFGARPAPAIAPARRRRVRPLPALRGDCRVRRTRRGARSTLPRVGRPARSRLGVARAACAACARAAPPARFLCRRASAASPSSGVAELAREHAPPAALRPGRANTRSRRSTHSNSRGSSRSAQAPRRRPPWSASCCARRRAIRSGCRSCCAADSAARATVAGVRWTRS